MSAEPFDALVDAIEAMQANRPDRALAAALIVLATEAARIRQELSRMRSEMEIAAHELGGIALALNPGDPLVGQP